MCPIMIVYGPKQKKISFEKVFSIDREKKSTPFVISRFYCIIQMSLTYLEEPVRKTLRHTLTSAENVLSIRWLVGWLVGFTACQPLLGYFMTKLV